MNFFVGVPVSTRLETIYWPHTMFECNGARVRRPNCFEGRDCQCHDRHWAGLSDRLLVAKLSDRFSAVTDGGAYGS
jgi:hypothetical protein